MNTPGTTGDWRKTCSTVTCETLYIILNRQPLGHAHDAGISFRIIGSFSKPRIIANAGIGKRVGMTSSCQRKFRN
jgi:hypothetical protein